MVEIEVKIKIQDFQVLKQNIAKRKVTLDKPRHLEENILYDFPDQRLYKKDQALRLRRIDKKYYLTFKGPHQKSRKFKIREEFETEIKNGKQFRSILKSLGLIPVFQYRKNRTQYKKKNLKICLDEMPIGSFLELEGEREEIVRFAEELGYTKDEFIKLDYVQLIKKAGIRTQPD